MVLGTWASFAWGSYNKDWENVNESWFGGFIFDIRPDFTFKISAHNNISVFFDYQNRTRFDKLIRDTWASGFYWTYK